MEAVPIRRAGGVTRSVTRVYRALVLLFFATLFVPLTAHPGAIAVPLWSIPVAGLLLMDLALRASSGDLSVRRFDHYDWSVVVFSAVMLGSSIVHTPYTELGFNKLVRYCMTLALALYVRRNWGRLFGFRQLVLFAFAFVAIQASVAALQYVTGEPIGYIGGYLGQSQTGELETFGELLGMPRVVGTLGGSPNMLGRVMLVLSPFVLYHGLRVPQQGLRAALVDRRLWLFLVSGVLLLTMSRSSILAFVVLGSVAWVATRVQSLRRRSLLQWMGLSRSTFLVLAVATAAVLVVLTSPQLRSQIVRPVVANVERVAALVDAGIDLQARAIEVRLELLEQGLGMFADNPFTGVGYQNTRRISEMTANPIIEWRELRVHNAYVLVLAEGGIVAFLAFLNLTLYPAVVSWRNRRRMPGAWAFVAAAVAILVVIQVGTTFDTSGVAPVYSVIWGGALGQAERMNSDSDGTGPERIEKGDPE